MARFTGAPGLWSRIKFLTAGSPYNNQYYVFDRKHKDYSSGPVFGNAQVTVRADQQRVAFNTVRWTIYSNPPVRSRLYALTVPPYGDTTVTAWVWGNSGETVAQPGLTLPNSSEAAPMWDLSDYTTPTSTPSGPWAGEWSNDGTVFASISRISTDATKLYLSVRQGGTALVTRQLLGITHRDYTTYASDAVKYEVRLLVRSATDIWIFHVNESSAGVGDRRLFLSRWNGSTIVSTTQLPLEAYNILSFEVWQGTAGLSYLVYTLYDLDNPNLPHAGPVSGKAFLRTINETTYAVSSVLVTTPTLASGTYGEADYRAMWLREGDRLPSNRPFTYKGVNYLVHVLAGHVYLVYTYTDAAPGTVTLLRWGFAPLYSETTGGTTAYESVSRSTEFTGKLTGIEYDPVSDTAVLVTMKPVTYAMMPFPSNKDYGRMYVLQYAEALDAPTWGMQVKLLSEVPSYVPSGNTSDYESDVDWLGYVPSRQGTSAVGFLLFQTTRVNSHYLHFVRTNCWHDPVTLEAEVSVDLGLSVEVAGSRDYPMSLALDLSPAIYVGGTRTRSTAWHTYWTQTLDTSVNGEVVIVLAPEIEVSGILVVPPTGEVEIDFNDSLDISITGECVRMFFLQESYPSIGLTFLEEFHQYVNEERAMVWGLPPLKIMGTTPESLDVLKSIDIAQRHCDNMVATRWYAHGAAAFPIGWRTADERIRLVSEVGGENIQYFSSWYPSGSPAPTALQAWTAWKNSPPHYANLMTDWDAAHGPGHADYIFSTLAYGFGLPPMYDGGGPPWDTYSTIELDPGVYNDPRWRTFFGTNNFLLIKEAYVEAKLTESWQKDELAGILLEHSWNRDGLAHVTSAHLATWAMPLTVAHEAPYGQGVTAWHEMVTAVPVSAAHEATHSMSSSLASPVGFVTPYDMPRLNATSSLEVVWASGVTAGHEAVYDDVGRVAAAHTATYDEFAKVTAILSSPYGQPVPVATHHASGYAIQRPVALSHTGSVLLSAHVSAAGENLYDLLVRNPVAQQNVHGYSMPFQAAAAFRNPQSTVSMNGHVMEIEDGFITCEYDAPGYSFQCAVKDLSFVAGAALGDRIDVVFEGTPYLFFLSGLSSSDAEKSAAPQVTLQGLSPVYQLDAPYAETFSYAPTTAKMFSEILQEVLGVPVDFSRHIDWSVPFGRAQSTSQTPLSFVKSLLDTIGSRLLSTPMGGLFVLPRYPVGMDAMPSGVPPHAFTELDNVFSRSSSYDYAKGYNRFRVRDSDASFGDIIEFDQDTSVATVWASPYRTSWRLECTTTPGILLDSQGEVVQEQEELWDFQAGAATAKYPILDLVSLTWLTDSLGGVAFAPHSTKVTAPLTSHFGYGLAKVVYRTKCSKFLLTSSTPIEATQLITVEL